jgi:cell division protein ZapA
MTNLEMNRSENLVRVTIYGQEYTVRGKADPSYIRSVAEYVDKKMREVGANITTAQSAVRIAILASMNITDELFATRQEKDEILDTVQNKSQRLTELISEHLE